MVINTLLLRKKYVSFKVPIFYNVQGTTYEHVHVCFMFFMYKVLHYYSYWSIVVTDDMFYHSSEAANQENTMRHILLLTAVVQGKFCAIILTKN